MRQHTPIRKYESIHWVVFMLRPELSDHFRYGLPQSAKVWQKNKQLSPYMH